MHLDAGLLHQAGFLAGFVSQQAEIDAGGRRSINARIGLARRRVLGTGLDLGVGLRAGFGGQRTAFLGGQRIAACLDLGQVLGLNLRTADHSLCHGGTREGHGADEGERGNQGASHF